MTKTEIKHEIQKVLDDISEDALQDILLFLKSLQEKSSGKLQLTDNLRRILSEDRELLEKLAK